MKKKVTTIAFLMVIAFAKSQIIFSEDFESYSTTDIVSSTVQLGDLPSSWLQQNLDGYGQFPNSSSTFDDYMDSYGFRVGNQPGFGKAVITRSSPNVESVLTLTDDILRTPIINIPNSLSFNTYLKCNITSDIFDSLKIFVSLNSSFSSPKQLVKSITLSSYSIIHPNIDISAFEGQNVYIYFEAFNNIYVTNLTSVPASGIFEIDDIQVVQETATTIDEKNNLNKLQLFPNPSKSTINIIGINNNDVKEISVIDMIGRTLLISSFTNQLSIESLNSGNYFVQIITNDNYTKTFKLIKE